MRPEDAEILDLGGWSYHRKRDHQTAPDTIPEAIRMEPTLASAHDHPAAVLEAASYFEPALAESE